MTKREKSPPTPFSEEALWICVQEHADYHARRLVKKWYIRRHGVDVEDLHQMMLVEMLQNSLGDSFRRVDGWRRYCWIASQFAAVKICAHFGAQKRFRAVACLEADSPLAGGSGELTLAAVISEDDRIRHRGVSMTADQIEDREIIQNAMEGMSARELAICESLMAGGTQMELAPLFGVTRQQISLDTKKVRRRLAEQFAKYERSLEAVI